MAMKSCPACGGKVSSTAQACPRCGDNLAARGSWWWALAIVVTMGIAAIVSLSADEPVPPQPVVVAQPRLSPEPLPVPDLPEIRPDEVANVADDYRHDVARMLNLLRREHPTCRRELKPYNAGPSTAQQDPANPRFFVQCGGMHRTEVIHFTWMDAVNGRLPSL